MIESGIVFIVILVSCAGFLAGRNVHSQADFLTVGGKASTLLALAYILPLRHSGFTTQLQHAQASS